MKECIGKKKDVSWSRTEKTTRCGGRWEGKTGKKKGQLEVSVENVPFIINMPETSMRSGVAPP